MTEKKTPILDKLARVFLMNRSATADDTSEEPEFEGDVYCSFCGKSREEVRTIVAGPDVFICDECVGFCDDIISEKIGLGPDLVKCSVCLTPVSLDECLFIPETRFFFCDACVSKIREVPEK